MNFDDREKKFDSMFNKFHIDYQKFLLKETCPLCNVNEVLRPLLASTWDEKNQKFVKAKWIHNDKDCFYRYATWIFALKKDENGKYIDGEILLEIIDRGYKMLKAIDKKYKEKGQ